LDGANKIYFSNRSACFAGLRRWEESAADAKECIRLDPSFLKGYYRYALALKEQRSDYETAIAAIRQGLAVDSTNEPLQKLLRQVQYLQQGSSPSKAASANPSAVRPGITAHMDEATRREFEDVRNESIQTARDAQAVQMALHRLTREKQISEITLGEIADLPQETTCYQSIGKVFLKTSQERVSEHLQKQKDDCGKRIDDLSLKKDHLQRRLQSQQQSIEDILQTVTVPTHRSSE
jgi:stress-induced-phosphoprotein 1